MPRRWFGSRRKVTLLVAAALIGVLAGSAAIGARFLTPPPVPPVVPSRSPSIAPSQPPSVQPWTAPAAGRIVYTRWRTLARGEEDCTTQAGSCHRASVFVSNNDGSGERELFPGPYSHVLAASPDGSKLIVSIREPDGDHVYLTDADGTAPRLLDTHCQLPCLGEFSFTFSADGSRLAFVRTRSGVPGPSGEDLVVATMDMASGAVAEVELSHAFWGRPGLSPDGARVAFGNHVVDVDGSNLKEIAPADLFREEQSGVYYAGLAAPQWSPDGSVIAFTSMNDRITTDPPDNSQRLMDIYVVRPDGTGLQRLTTDTVEPPADTEVGDFGAGFPTWTLDGRIAFSRYPTRSEDPYELWVMDPDGGNATRIDPSNAAALTALGCVACPYPGTTAYDVGMPVSAFWIPGR